jgi:hypothetical protein
MKFGWRESIQRPETFSQKIYYLRNAYKNVPLASLVSDKIKVREYVQEKVGGGILNNLLGVYDDPKDIDYTKLPDRFVIKTNHASGTNIIVKDKSSLDIKTTTKQLSEWLKMNYSNSSGEMQYYNIKPQILIEEYLENEGYGGLLDYKFFCYDGVVDFLYIKRNVGFNAFKIYSLDLNFEINEMFEAKDLKVNHFNKPKSFQVMVEAAGVLSKGLPFVRVDFYDINGKCIFGEMTLTPTGGNNYYLKDDEQISLGKKINLSILDTIRSEY